MTTNGRPGGSPYLRYASLILLAVAALTYLSYTYFGSTAEAVSMAEVVEKLRGGEVESIVVQGNDVKVTLTGDEAVALTTRLETGATLIETLEYYGVDASVLEGVELTILETNRASWVSTLLFTVLPLAFLAWMGITFMRQMRSGPDQAAGFARAKPRTLDISHPKVTFEDVAGIDESKQELSEIVEFLKEPEKFLRLGARVPKGVLMIGPPGTGKTLLARAIAGEAGVPFLHISGSEFVEMFVGVGASRVRDLFERAKKVAPAIVFVDEIDAVGRMRGAGLGGGNDEREQTLNQILVEMDGFENDTNVIVIAATNRADVLDPALLRPGRFDRKVYIHMPDVTGRAQILGVHMRGKPIDGDVQAETMAKLTPGFSGADIENLVNEAAILAAQRGKKKIGMIEFQDAMEKIVAGPERRSRVVSPEERRVIAYHEAGHAVVMHHLTHSDPVHKITIIPRGGAGGYTMYLPESADSMLRSRDQLQDMIVGLLGGRAAEDLTFGSITTGASDDLKRATNIAQAMVTRFGMSEKTGLRVFDEDDDAVFLGRTISRAREYSEDTARVIDGEVAGILDDAYSTAKRILTENKVKIDALADKLLEVETVDREQFIALMTEPSAA